MKPNNGLGDDVDTMLAIPPMPIVTIPAAIRLTFTKGFIG